MNRSTIKGRGLHDAGAAARWLDRMGPAVDGEAAIADPGSRRQDQPEFPLECAGIGQRPAVQTSIIQTRRGLGIDRALERDIP